MNSATVRYNGLVEVFDYIEDTNEKRKKRKKEKRKVITYHGTP